MAQEQIPMQATRDGFGEGLVELGRKNAKVVVVSADLTESTRAGWFKEKYPDRFVSCGVAEQDMIGVGAGLALAGKLPFVCTFGVFASGRAWDQIRVSLAYMNLNVCIVGTHGGLTVGEDGATHQALEEMVLMRSLPNMTVVIPADGVQAKRATIMSITVPGPVYLRLGRNKMPVFTKETDPFEFGKAQVVRRGRDVTVIACGVMVYEALQAAELLAREGIDLEIINLHTVKPIDVPTILASVRTTNAVVTAEEHTIVGGMGSAVSEVLSQHYPVPVVMLGVDDQFGESGTPEQLLDRFGLTRGGVVRAVKQVLARKKSA